VPVTFAGTDFREVKKDEIDFSGFEFGDNADFSGCKWRGVEFEAKEIPIVFKPGRACFTGAIFGHRGRFNAVFGGGASFERAKFGHWTNIAFACDTDHDRHGIVARSAGLLPPNHYLSVAILYLFLHRPNWNKDAAVGKTVVIPTARELDSLGIPNRQQT
jgi:hypothetical protein